jgi:hypothetical protein
MYNVLILWAPDSAENRRSVESVLHAFEPLKIAPVAKKAAEATIADVNNADIVLFGAQKPAAAEAPPDFDEHLRVFKGVSLAGRTAGFFAMGGEKASARLRKALKDTDISQFEEEPLLADPRQGNGAEVADWTRKLVAFHKEMMNARA